MPSGDLVKLAYLVFQTYSSQEDEVDRTGSPRKSRAIGALPVDEAMSDDGWKVWSYEEHRSASVDDLDTIERFALEHELDSLFGFTWRHQIHLD